MCKDCQYWSDGTDQDGNPFNTKERLFADLEKHKQPHGYSGYGGAAWCFTKYLDDKETIDVIIEVAKKKKWFDVVEQGIIYRTELAKSLQKLLA